MSSCYFSKLFKRMTGKNYITYVTDSRIEMAKRMLVDTEMPVINIAYELSYNETNYFSKAFKKKVGVTPSEYRTAHSELFREQGRADTGRADALQRRKGWRNMEEFSFSTRIFLVRARWNACAGCRTKSYDCDRPFYGGYRCAG
ncbi:helix-turn-helix transcriptional regulator [Flavonifractor plautii]|nr:helix-turn-helix transcriptional regulator [Flavonifractor plautii]